MNHQHAKPIEAMLRDMNGQVRLGQMLRNGESDIVTIDVAGKSRIDVMRDTLFRLAEAGYIHDPALAPQDHEKPSLALKDILPYAGQLGLEGAYLVFQDQAATAEE